MESLFLNWNINGINSDLALYLPRGSFSDLKAIVDFTQWGTARNGRESVVMSRGMEYWRFYIDRITL